MKPDYTWAALNSRLEGVESKGNKRSRAEPSVRVDYITFIKRDRNDANLILVEMGSQKVAFVHPGGVRVQYGFKSDTMHRRLNEILLSIGWAVVDREGEWLLIKRKQDDEAYRPFPPHVLAAIERGADNPVFEPEVK